MKTFPFCLAIVLSSSAGAALAQSINYRYSLTAVAPPGSRASGINSAGDIVGAIQGSGSATDGFIATGNAYTRYAMEGASSTSFNAINDSGAIAGFALLNGQYRAIKYSRGTFAPIALPPNDFDSVATAINNNGTIVGGFSSNMDHGFMDQNGVVSTIPDAVRPSMARDINDAGTVVGSLRIGNSEHAYVYANGTTTLLTGANAIHGEASAINERGVVVGTFYTSNGTYTGYRYDNGRNYAFGRLGSLRMAINDINSSNMFVGNILWAGAPDDSGFIHDESSLFDLDRLLVDAGGWHVTNAAAINDSGQIAATGCYRPTGLCQAVRLDISPIPEPGAWSMLLAGLCLVGDAARRRARVRESGGKFA